MKSTIEITFNEYFPIGASLQFQYLIPGQTIQTFQHNWYATRVGAFQVEAGSSQFDTFGNYEQAASLDSVGLFDVIAGLGSVLITAVDDDVVFSNFSSSNNATEVINNQTAPTVFNIDNATVVPAVTNDICTHVRIDVVSNLATTSVTSPISLTPNATSWSFEYVRGLPPISIVATDGGDTDTQSVTIPSVLDSPIVGISNSPTGATITISVTNVDLNLEYSIDSAPYQTDNFFSGIAPGAYTAKVRDQFNCEKTASFTVSTFTPIVPDRVDIAQIAKTNPLVFKDSEVWNNKDIYKTINNTLSCEEWGYTGEKTYWYVHPRQPEDIESIQIISTYETILASIVDGDNLIPLTVEKKTENLNVSETIQGTIYNVGSGISGMYFDAFPQWAEIGFSFFVDTISSYVTITTITIDSSVNNKVIQFNSSFTGTPVVTDVTADYNKFPFEIYEVQYDYHAYLDKDVRLAIGFEDSVFENKYKVSELINVQEYQKDTKEIRYKNTQNNDIYWPVTGIWCQTRVRCFTPQYIPETESENNVTDTTVVNVNTSKYDRFKFIMPRVTTAVGRQLNQIFGCNIIEVDREKHRLAERGELSKYGNSNYHNFEVDLYKIETAIGETEEIDFTTKFVINPLVADASGILTDDSEAVLS